MRSVNQAKVLQKWGNFRCKLLTTKKIPCYIKCRWPLQNKCTHLLSQLGFYQEEEVKQEEEKEGEGEGEGKFLFKQNFFMYIVMFAWPTSEDCWKINEYSGHLEAHLAHSKHVITTGEYEPNAKLPIRIVTT